MSSKDGKVQLLLCTELTPFQRDFLSTRKDAFTQRASDPAALKEFLVDRYGMDESLEEPDEETDDTPEVSGLAL